MLYDKFKIICIFEIDGDDLTIRCPLGLWGISGPVWDEESMEKKVFKYWHEHFIKGDYDHLYPSN